MTARVMIERGVAIGAVSAMLATLGCASTSRDIRYEKAGMSEEQRKRDEAECLQVGLGAPSARPYPAVDRDLVDRCMLERGYAIRR